MKECTIHSVPPDAAPDDCMHCASCCFSESPRHVRVTGDDYERLGDAAEVLVQWIENQTFMRLTTMQGAQSSHRCCVALRYDPDESRFSCGIYNNRPEACRHLERTSPACLGELDRKQSRSADVGMVQLRTRQTSPID